MTPRKIEITDYWILCLKLFVEAVEFAVPSRYNPRCEISLTSVVPSDFYDIYEVSVTDIPLVM